MMPILNFRVPPELWAAAEERAAKRGLTIRDSARKLIEEDTGIEVEVKHGLAGSTQETRARVGSLGGNAKARNQKPKKRKLARASKESANCK